MHQDDVNLHSSIGAKPSAETPLTGMRHFLHFMLKKAASSSLVLLASTVYLNRIRASRAYRLTRESFCVLTSVCLYLATKFLHDKVFSVKHWASAAGFTVADFLSAERELLRTLQFELFVSPNDLQQLLALANSAPQVTKVTAQGTTVPPQALH